VQPLYYREIIMTASKDKTFVLAGDIGGTKTNLGLFLEGKERPVPKVIETFSSRDASHLEDIVRQFLEIHPKPVTRACFGIAGPVINGKSKTTNLPWSISEDRIKKEFKFHHVKLVNDLAATVMAIPLLSKDELHPLNQAASVKNQNLALIAPGTGLGKAMLIYQNNQFYPVSSEGGHADFAPNNESEVDLWRYLHQRYGHVSIERVLSGSGLVNIYNWLKDSDRFSEPEWLAQKRKEMGSAAAIAQTALASKDLGCIEALNRFVSIFGAVAGNLALTGMTTGGVYLGGGIPPKILSKLKEDIFINAFTNKGRFKGFLKKIPVKVVLNDKAALIGAAYCAMKVK
jgi:glucokinase